MISKRQVTELKIIDIALSSVIKNMFESLAVAGTEAFQRFLKREVKSWLYRIEEDSPSKVLRAIRGETKSIPDLPIVSYYRSIGLSNGDRIARFPFRTGYNKELTRAINAKLLPVSLEYSVMFISWDKSTLDEMQAAWYAFMSCPESRRFIAPVKFVGDDSLFHIPATILDPKSIMFSNRSEESSERRLYAVQHPITVETHMLYGSGIEAPDRITIEGECTSYIRNNRKMVL